MTRTPLLRSKGQRQGRQAALLTAALTRGDRENVLGVGTTATLHLLGGVRGAHGGRRGAHVSPGAQLVEFDTAILCSSHNYHLCSIQCFANCHQLVKSQHHNAIWRWYKLCPHTFISLKHKKNFTGIRTSWHCSKQRKITFFEIGKIIALKMLCQLWIGYTGSQFEYHLFHTELLKQVLFYMTLSPF